MQLASHHSTLLKEIKQELINTGWNVEESETPAHSKTTYYITSEEAPAPYFWEGGIIGLFHSGYAIIKVRTTDNGRLIFQSDGKYNDERQQAMRIVEALNDKIGVYRPQ